MEKQRKRSFSMVILMAILMLSFPSSTVGKVFRLLFEKPLTLRRLQLLWDAYPGEILFAVFYLLCALLLIRSLLRLIRPAGKQQVRKTKPVHRAKEKEIEKTKDAPIRCEHKTGTEKYLEQIDGFLKSGLIDREEYRILRDRYSKLDIPDDYH